MPRKISKELIDDCLQAANLHPNQFIPDYAGRGMSDTCFGIVGSFRDVAKFFYALGWHANDLGLPQEEGDEPSFLADLMESDRRALDRIYYFPGVVITDDDEDDSSAV